MGRGGPEIGKEGNGALQHLKQSKQTVVKPGKGNPSTGVYHWAASALVHLIYCINTDFRVICPQKDLDSVSIAVARA